MLVGNKLDLAASRKTPRALGEQFAKEEGLLFCEASAKNGEGVEPMFMEIGECECRRKRGPRRVGVRGSLGVQKFQDIPATTRHRVLAKHSVTQPLTCVARKLPLTQPKTGQQGVKVAPKQEATPSACTC